MTQPQRLASALALCTLSLGCSGSDEAPPAELELLTWWSQQSERRAIEAVIAVYEAEHPKATVRVLYADNPDVLTNNVNGRLADGTPPTAFQANLGGNALQWAESAQPLNARAAAWRSAFQPTLLEELTAADGSLVGVPIALTRQNNVYYNTRVLAELGMVVPRGQGELQRWLEALAEAGYTHPLCLGDSDNWVSAHVLFEDIVPGFIGAERSRQFWSGELSADDAELGAALDYAATLNPYWNEDANSIDWDVGLKRVMERAKAPAEQCLLTPMGDWGGAVLSEEWTAGEDFTQATWPGAEGLFVLAGDAFVTVRGVDNQAAALDFFDTLASEAGQVAFNEQKGAVPARTVSEEVGWHFGPLTRANMADLAEGTAVPGYKVLGSSRFPFDDLAKLSHDFLLVGDKQPLVDFIAKNYAKLKDR